MYSSSSSSQASVGEIVRSSEVRLECREELLPSPIAGSFSNPSVMRASVVSSSATSTSPYPAPSIRHIRKDAKVALMPDRKRESKSRNFMNDADGLWDRDALASERSASNYLKHMFDEPAARVRPLAGSDVKLRNELFYRMEMNCTRFFRQCLPTLFAAYRAYDLMLASAYNMTGKEAVVAAACYAGAQKIHESQYASIQQVATAFQVDAVMVSTMENIVAQFVPLAAPTSAMDALFELLSLFPVAPDTRARFVRECRIQCHKAVYSMNAMRARPVTVALASIYLWFLIEGESQRTAWVAGAEEFERIMGRPIPMREVRSIFA